MLLLNKGMMQFIKHPFHRNDLSNMSENWLYLLSGPPHTELELQAARNTSSTVPFNTYTIYSNIKGSRTELQAFFVTPLAKKAHGENPDESVFRYSENPSVIQIANSGKLEYIFSTFHSGANYVGGRKCYLFSVGLPGSGADIEMEKVDYVVGERIKLNDIVINIQNLLGEA